MKKIPKLNGVGVFTYASFPTGSAIVRYVGETISLVEGNYRDELRDAVRSFPAHELCSSRVTRGIRLHSWSRHSFDLACRCRTQRHTHTALFSLRARFVLIRVMAKTSATRLTTASSGQICVRLLNKGTAESTSLSSVLRGFVAQWVLLAQEDACDDTLAQFYPCIPNLCLPSFAGHCCGRGVGLRLRRSSPKHCGRVAVVAGLTARWEQPTPSSSEASGLLSSQLFFCSNTWSHMIVWCVCVWCVCVCGASGRSRRCSTVPTVNTFCMCQTVSFIAALINNTYSNDNNVERSRAAYSASDCTPTHWQNTEKAAILR